MSQLLDGATWTEHGELVLDIFKDPPKNKGKDRNTHTYKEIDCGGDCGGCVALIVDGQVVSGPPFHRNCNCTLTASAIEDAPEQESNMDDAVAADRNSNPEDILWLKDALTKLGFYEPDSRAGETSEDLNEYPNQNLFDAIDKFQREHKLSERGIVKPGYQTEAKINNELRHQTKKPKPVVKDGKTTLIPASEKTASTTTEKPTFERPVDTNSGYYATFDGKAFTLYVDNKPVISWDAVSGKKEYQSPKYQSEKNKGPIPAGKYVARQEKLQHITTADFLAGLVPGKHGGWPGSYYSWGDSRVWLEPAKATNTYGRDNFSIHGGMVPGSAGCIDLTHQMDNFVALFKYIGKDLIVEVKY